MNIFIVIIYDTTSYEADKRVEIKEVFSTKQKAENYASDLILNSCEAYSVEEYEIDSEEKIRR